MNDITCLLIEDEPQIRRVLRTSLEGAGCRVFEAATAARGLIEAGTRKPDLVILDLGLPDLDGVDVVREIRAWSEVPILILSARTDEVQKVIALDAGADDYLTKPFGVGELHARVRALTRRRLRETDTTARVRFGEVEMDLLRRLVTRNGEAVRLSPIEYRLLAVLVGNPGKVLTHRFLMREVWGPAHSEHGHYLRVYIFHLRQKLEADPAQPAHLLTETGVGYRFAVRDDPIGNDSPLLPTTN